MKGSKALQNGTEKKIYDRITVLYVKEWKIMRIISQDGCYDIPYEQVTLLRFKEGIYLMSKNFAGVEGITEDPMIAEYSTEEKAIKAMEMCRQEYGKYYSVEGEISPITGVVIQPGIFTCPKVFQFPKDEEVK